MPAHESTLATVHRWAFWVAGVWALLVSGPSLRAGPDPVSFRHEVMAVLSKGGCASGPCHGNRQGKGGFKLSLRGESPGEDYLTLVNDLSGRRLDRQSPDDSLLLLKPTGQVPHEGLTRFGTDSVEFRLLRDWILQGARDDGAAAPRLVKLEVSPREQFMTAPWGRVQIRTVAEFSDGTRREVGRLAVYEPVAPILDVTAEGLVTARQAGETTVLVRYLDRQEAVRLAFLPDRERVWWWQQPRPVNFIDEQIHAKLLKLRLEASAVCSDEAFVRRVYLDLCGILPTAAEARAFVAETSPDKRAHCVDSLFERREFAEYWALKWADLFRLEERALDRKGAQLFHEWLVQEMADNTPLDVFTRRLLTARGGTYSVPAANWFRSHRTPVERGEAVAQVFLGTRLQCAQCHNHPYERWTQNDYHDWTAAFARVDYKVIENRRRDDNDKHEFVGEQVVFASTRGEHRHPKSGRICEPRLLGGPAAIAGDADPLETLASWMTRPGNPLFARAQANRIWYHLMGRGLVDPVDDFRSTNPASHPELLEGLAAELAGHGFDMRHLIRMIIASKSYQASSVPRPGAADDVLNYSHTVVRRLPAEALLDALSQAAGVRLEFANLPSARRAAQLPGPDAIRGRGRRKDSGSGAELDIFLKAFGKPPRQLTTECERSGEPAMNQVFQLVSGPTVHDLVTDPSNRLAGRAESDADMDGLLEDLFWSSITRSPTPAERAALSARLKRAGDRAGRRAAAEDILWGLLNSKEFILRH